jgi:hypothetical protein
MDLDHRHARDAGTELGRRVAAAVFTLACLGLSSARAQALSLDDAGAGTVVPQAAEPAAADEDSGPLTAARAGLAWRWEALPRARYHAMPFEPAHAGRSAARIDYRLWFGDQRTEVGLGFAPQDYSRSEAGAPLALAPHEAHGVVLAFRHQLSAQSRLTVDTRWSGNSDSLTHPARGRAFDLGLESSPLQGLAKGTLLRAQLNSYSSIALRLRGGRLGLYLGVRITGAE